MKQRIMTGWNFRRVFYLLIGIAVIVQVIIEKQWVGVLFGGYFAAMGLFNFGCASGNCASGSCQTKPTRRIIRRGEE